MAAQVVLIRAVACAALATLALASSALAAPVPTPTVHGPVTGGLHGYAWNKTLTPLRGKGYSYREREYFFSGLAREGASRLPAPYESRMLVRLPRNPKRFSGTVVVEWLNVTMQSDLEWAWPNEARYLMRHGIGYVGVSAQAAGICCGPGTLKGWDARRYAPLVHPGDPFAHDIFSQAIRALRAPPRVDPMRGMRVRHLVATGASQSALQLTAFVNGGYNRGQIDAYMITRGGGPFRDFSTPIFHINEENMRAPQPDNPRYRAWEEAGTAHAPQVWWGYIARQQRRDLAAPVIVDVAEAGCKPNHGSVDYTTRAMTRAVTRYVRTGRMPPRAPRVKRSSGAILRDRHGLARGGLRQPFVEVPVGFNTSAGCFLVGHHEPWSAAKIRSVHRTHRRYLRKLRRATKRDVRRGWLLPGDRRTVLRKARRFRKPWRKRCSDACPAPLGL